MDHQEIQASGFVVQPRLPFKNTKDKMLYQLFNDLANYENSVNCKRGELITSSLSLVNETGWSRGDIRGSIKRLEEAGYISSRPYHKNKGLLISVTSYDNYQKLGTYSKKINQHANQRENQQSNQHNNQSDNQQSKPDKPCESKGEGQSKSEANQLDNQHANQLENQHINQLENHTITAFFNSMLNSNININKTLKQYVDQSGVKKMNLTSIEDIESFVDFALLTNAFPEKVSRKVLVTYFDCIRLNRATCHISAKVLANITEKVRKYSANQINYALWKHVADHDDKPEKYTLGILRNVTEPDACRGLIKLKNKKGAATNDAIAKEYAQAAGAEQSSTRAEAERLQQLARSKGFGTTIRDSELDF